ncbi:MAG TPA: hypothetical protein VKR58_00430, partial [Aquella sp.]|nr:hypothetical protein [Aquella sp.]
SLVITRFINDIFKEYNGIFILKELEFIENNIKIVFQDLREQIVYPDDTLIIENVITCEDDIENLETAAIQGKYLRNFNFDEPILNQEHMRTLNKGSEGEEETKVITDENYVIKIHHIVNDPANMAVNEAYVGLCGINKLRPRIPYFALIKGITFNDNARNVYYEYVDGIPIVDYIHKHNTKDCVHILNQIFFALYIAHNEMGYTHHDLNHNNILIKELPESIHIKIPHTEEYIEFDTKVIPVIIDYEFSHIKHEGKSYGRKFSEFNIQNTSFWVGDVFKLLMFLYAKTSKEFNIQVIDDLITKLQTSIGSSDIKKISGLLKLKETCINIFNGNSELKLINSCISEYLSFFTDGEMTAEYFREFHEFNRVYTLYPTKRLSSLKFEDFIDFILNKK